MLDMTATYPPQIVGFLKDCVKKKDLHKGTRLHAYILCNGLLEKNYYVAINLVNMYAKCGALAKAQHLLDELTTRDVVSWNVIITGYCQQSRVKEALNCFEQMQCEGHSPDAITYTCILKACSSTGAVDNAEKIHGEARRRGFLGKDIMVATALLDMYGKAGALEKAWQVLMGLSVRDVVAWSAIIMAYAQHGKGEEALECLEQMLREGHCPDSVTFICALKACGSIGAADKGKQIHDEVVKRGLLGSNVMLGNALVDMYAKCGALAKARRVLEELCIRDVVTWNTLITGYVQQGQLEEALICFDWMRQDSLPPDEITFISVLTACGCMGAVDKGKWIHGMIVLEGLLEKNIALGNSLLDMYAKCGALKRAQELLDQFHVRTVVSWNTLISGYAQRGLAGEALSCFDQLQCEGVSPNDVTYVVILTACASMGAAYKGKKVHDEIVLLGLIEKNQVLGNVLVDLYVKCGDLEKAREVLNQLPIRDQVSWNSLIAGYAQTGETIEVLDCIMRMHHEGVFPNNVTFVCMLNACSHAGVSDEGQMCFTNMIRNFDVMSTVEHHCCMVDIFGRTGLFTKALAVVEKMPFCDYLPIWHALLGACRKWGNLTLARLAFRFAEHVDKDDAAAYVCIDNIRTADFEIE